MAEPLSDALFRFVAGRSPRWERDYSPGWVARAVREAGSQNKLASALGVARATVQGWVKGATPSLESQELLRAALRRADLGRGREARIRGQDRVTIHADQDGRSRIITLDERYLIPGTMDRVVSAYLAGATPIELQRVFWNGIHNSEWYKTVFFPGGVQKAQEASGGGGGAPGRPQPSGAGSGAQSWMDELAYEGLEYDVGDSGAVAVVGVSS